MKKPIFILFLFIVSLTFGQQLNIVNQKTLGGSDYDLLRSAIPVSNSQILVSGYTRSDISYDKTVEFYGGAIDGWVIKLDSSFSIIWQKELGGTSTDFILKSLYLSDGNYLCVGFSSSPVSGNKTVDTIGGSDVWVVKMDTAGNILWQNVYGGTGDEDFYLSAKELPNKHIVIGCESKSDSSGTKTENSRGSYDYWVFEIDSAGNQLWDKTIGGSGEDELIDVIINPNGNILLSGTSDSPVSGEKTEANHGYDDYWLVQLDSNGNILWDKTFGGDDFNYAIGHGIYYNHAYYIFGSSTSQPSGNKTDVNYGGDDYWLIKVNEQGQKLWDKSYGGSLTEYGRSIIISNTGYILITGTSNSDTSGNKTELNKGAGDYWALLLDTNGIIQSQVDVGGSDYEGYNIAFEKSHNNYVLAGDSKSDISGDKTEFCRGNYDFWMVQLNTTVGIDMQELPSAIKLYPNPTTGSLTFVLPDKQGNCAITFFNAQGEQVKCMELSGQSKVYHTNIGDLPAGLYFYRMTQNNNILKYGKIVKE